ncbi:MAG: dihydrofolate reductase [Phycisphaerales bacterium]|nr:dihydrofolate reductase [Phycisphaerales bacterium]
MPTNESTVTIHMVSSLDGFVCKPDGDVAWLETSDRYEAGIADEDAIAFLGTVDCFVLGARTYETALKLGWPYSDVPVIVLTTSNMPADRASVQFLSGDLAGLVRERLRPRYKNIWVVGGPTLVRDFLRMGLADEVRVTIAPVIIGGGLPFFDRTEVESALHLKDVTAYKSGMVELSYVVRTD